MKFLEKAARLLFTIILVDALANNLDALCGSSKPTAPNAHRLPTSPVLLPPASATGK